MTISIVVFYEVIVSLSSLFIFSFNMLWNFIFFLDFSPEFRNEFLSFFTDFQNNVELFNKKSKFSKGLVAFFISSIV